MKNLKEKQYYIDRYDKMTVEDTRRFIKNVLNSSKDEETKAVSKMFYDLIMYYHNGEAYMNKEPTIQKWMEKDRERDLIYESAQEPNNIRCRCSKKMHSTLKTFYSDERILFFFNCPSGCLPRRAIFSNGEELESKNDNCSNCNVELNQEMKRSDDIITTIYTCKTCDYVNTETLDLSVKKKEVDPDYEKDRKLFCLSDEEGFKFADHVRNMKAVNEMMKEREEKEAKKDIYDQVEKMNKLSIPQVKDFVEKFLSKSKYENLTFEKADISRVVSLSFSIEDPSNTHEFDSKQNLKKIIKSELKNTNWRLMSDGISCRLGLLSGKIRVYENEKDLARLIEKNK